VNITMIVDAAEEIETILKSTRDWDEEFRLLMGVMFRRYDVQEMKRIMTCITEYLDWERAARAVEEAANDPRTNAMSPMLGPKLDPNAIEQD
jgi:hypothetical protein